MNKINPKLILVRGLPGSGKSTIAKTLTGYVHVEADMYHYQDDKYCFKIENIKLSHEWCMAETENQLDAGKRVVVSNTFTQMWEMEPYFNMGVETSVIVAHGSFKSIHNVPEEAIKRMADRFEL